MWKAFPIKWKRMLYMLCFAMFCLIDQRAKTCNDLEGWAETFRDLTGTVISVILLSHYKLSDFLQRKVVYLIWNLSALTGGILFAVYGEAVAHFFNDRIAIAAGVLLFGNVVIHTFTDVVIDKKRPALHKKLAGLWLIMMVLMILSRSRYIWPFTYLLMFGCFYLTDFTREEREDLFQGMLDGVILAFFLMQGWCFVFRPFDVVRYLGVYSNSNMNALFYLEVLAAVFVRLACLAGRERGKWNNFLKLFYWLGAGVVYAFLFLTIGRIAWVTSFVLGFVFLWAMQRIQQKKTFVKNGVVIILCFCLTFPIVFASVRYLPPFFHHPVWFYGEWEESKVHSWDLYDSEKFIDLDEFMSSALGRVTEGFQNLLKHSPFAITAEADSPKKAYRRMLKKGYALPPEKSADSLAVRKAIYKYYADHLNLLGHPYEEQGFQLLPNYWVGHAHNIYLQYGTDFGVIMMAVFIVLTVGTVVNLSRRFYGTNSPKLLAVLLFFLIPMVFGLAEYSWGVGSLSITMMFIVWRDVFVDEKA